MKKALLVMAVLIAVVASATIGGVQTASAFNPQPEPPGAISGWFDTMFPVDASARGVVDVDAGTAIANAPGGAVAGVR